MKAPGSRIPPFQAAAVAGDLYICPRLPTASVGREAASSQEIPDERQEPWDEEGTRHPSAQELCRRGPPQGRHRILAGARNAGIAGRYPMAQLRAELRKSENYLRTGT